MGHLDVVAQAAGRPRPRRRCSPRAQPNGAPAGRAASLRQGKHTRSFPRPIARIDRSASTCVAQGQRPLGRRREIRRRTRRTGVSHRSSELFETMGERGQIATSDLIWSGIDRLCKSGLRGVAVRPGEDVLKATDGRTGLAFSQRVCRRPDATPFRRSLPWACFLRSPRRPRDGWLRHFAWCGCRCGDVWLRSVREGEKVGQSGCVRR